MSGLHKFRPKRLLRYWAVPAFCILITFVSNAGRASRSEIYSTLTSDTIPRRKPGPVDRPGVTDTTVRPIRITPAPADTNPRRDTGSHRPDSLVNITDTFDIRMSKDTLDAPVNYEASDSGVLFVKENRFVLYGKTKTEYRDITLTAPRVEIDQATGIVTAVNQRDSTGEVIARAEFKQGTEGFQSDTIRYNFKTRRGLTTNTPTRLPMACS
jgi:LPS-assembly protein